MEKAYLESIETLRYTVEAKDTYTRGHSDRVSEYSVLIGKYLNLPEEDLKTLQIGGLFHDVGKIVLHMTNDKQYSIMKNLMVQDIQDN